MKKLLLAAVMVLGVAQANAQDYKNALGLVVDLGDGETLFGPQFKHSFDGRNAGNVQVMFGDGITTLGADYTYNESINGANGLNWFVGVGPQLSFVDGGRFDDKTYFAIRPQVGLEYKIPSAPLAFHFDWKPWWNLSNDSNFEAGRFSLGFKYTLN
ncbi:hypothetical protein SAMN05443634_105222 [Chishuiella changwenlii]|jgi:hypothetical protein|uniref:Outer membrane insertion C-terminal signal n=1 Tax=Chishuiella changwenlii TaxID=1434701 RepID=A0A1M6XES1_9FLAO|nr:hypothetical protein [Chishuiella changwenlii]GGF00575.1 hypothetical protein GCM10010984_17740 [Chishuiella changwenlii]SHL04418.1 hypothetical protein SAMN05443634_105222 [Chishuiella changwenlii]